MTNIKTMLVSLRMTNRTLLGPFGMPYYRDV